MGYTMVLKPASQTPLTAIAFADICREVGLPPGVLNVITGPGSSVGQAIVEHPGIDKIAFTGDTSTGKGIMRGAAETLKKITLELGGKSPNIILPDADHNLTQHPYVIRRTWDYFVEHLLGATPPRDYTIAPPPR